MGVLFAWFCFCFIVSGGTTSLDDKYHVFIANIPSRGRSNQLFAIAEELLTNGNDQYFITFLVDTSCVHFLDEFIARYPLEENQNNFQIITAPKPDNAIVDAPNFIKLIEIYAWLWTAPLYNIYPTLHRYLEASDYLMITKIDDYSKYNVSEWNKDEVIFKPIDVLLSDYYNTATFALTKIYQIPTVVLNTLYVSGDTYFYLQDAALVHSRRIFEDFPNYPHFSYIQSLLNKIERFIFLTVTLQHYVIPQYNKILSNEYNITDSIFYIHDDTELYSEVLILKSMGPPVSVKDTFISQRAQYTGFLLAKHLSEEEPWLDSVIMEMFQPHAYKEILEWMNDTANIIYVAFGTIVGEDELTVKLVEFLVNDVFTADFLQANDFYVLWSIRNETKAHIFHDYSHKRIRFQAWLPQRELLHHPHIKLFITHGGTSSILESVYAMKPMLFASFGFAERIGNGIILKKTGCSDYIQDLDDFEEVHTQILHLIQVKDECKKLKEMMEFFGGTQHAMKVLNYAIRFGTKSLIPSVTKRDLSWHQKTYADIYVILITIILLLYYGLRRCCACCCTCNSRKVHDKTD